MRLETSQKMIGVMVGIAVLAIAFWMLLLSPKREEAAELGKQVEQVESSLATHETEVDEALQARAEFPENYEQLVVLGKAVPADDDTPSLIVQINRIAKAAKVDFRNLELEAGGGEEELAPAPTEAGQSTAGAASPTEVAASTLPLGATIGPAGLAVMPYNLTFEGNFFKIADFIEGLDELVETENARVAVSGRLITIGGFSLEPAPNKPFPTLKASFAVTTYLTPPSEGVTGGATPSSPGEAVPASATIEGAP